MKSFRIAMACLLAACACAVGQEEDFAKQRFLVRVIDADGDPVEGAMVLAADIARVRPMALAAFAKGRTDKTGRFIFVQDAPERGFSPVLVMKDGTSLGACLLHFGTRMEAEHVVRLGESSTVTGTVTDEKGLPVAGATVRFDGSIPGIGVLVGIPPFDALITRTDAQGRFAFPNVPIDTKFGFVVDAPGMATTMPGRSGPDRPYCVGQEGIIVRMKPEIPVRGRVIDEQAGQPVAGAEFTVQDFQLGAPKFRSDEEGRFEIHGLSEGEFTIVEARDVAGQTDLVLKSVSLKLEAGKPPAPLELRVTKGGRVSISFIDRETRKPIRVGRVSLEEKEDIGWWTQGQISCNQAGVATARLLPGEYEVKFERPRGYLSGTEGELGDFTVEPGKTTKLVFLLNRLPIVTGKVVDEADKPVPYAQVDLATEQGREITVADDHGRFAMPMPHQDRAWLAGSREPQVPGLLVRSPERNLAACMLVPDTTKPLRVKLKPATVLTGTVTDTKGNPLIERLAFFAEMQCPDENSDEDMGNVYHMSYLYTTDAEGRYIIPALPKGLEWRIRLRLGSGFPVLEGQMDKLVVSVEPAALPAPDATITGTVIDPQGKAVPGVHVAAICRTDRTPRHTIADSEGRFTLKGLTACDVDIRAFYCGKTAEQDMLGWYSLDERDWPAAGSVEVRIRMAYASDWDKEPETESDVDF